MVVAHVTPLLQTTVAIQVPHPVQLMVITVHLAMIANQEQWFPYLMCGIVLCLVIISIQRLKCVA